MLTLLLVGAVVVPNAHATTTSNEAMLEQIKVLMAKLEDLQKQLATIRGEVKSVLKDGLSEGMTDADIAKLQELLATDPTIYPEGKKTGYFGPLTKEAVKRFQARHGLEVTGKVDGETHDMLEEYLHEGFGDKIPAGLLHAPGIAKKIEARMLLGCDKREKDGHGMGPLCKKWKMEHGDKNDDKNDDSDNEDEDFNVEVEIENGDTALSFTFDGDDYEVTVDNSTDSDDVLDAAADKIKDGDDASDLDNNLKAEIKKELAKAVSDSSDTTARQDARDAINDAKDAINQAENMIDDDNGDTSDAEDALDDAKNALDDAENAYDDEEYADAEDFANDAEDFANDAEDLLDQGTL